MNKIMAIAIVGVFIAAAIPGVNAASETHSAEYDVPSATNGNPPYLAVSTRLCAPEWDEDWWLIEDEDPAEQVLDPVMGTACPTARGAVGRPDSGAVNVGIFSAGIRSDVDAYTNFLVTVTDTLPANSYFTFCVITDHQDGRGGKDTWCGENLECDPDINPEACDDIADPSTAGCGSVSVDSALPAGGPANNPTAFVFATYVDEVTAAVCLASKGTLTVTMSN